MLSKFTGYFVFNFKTVMEYGGNSRVKFALKPFTFSECGTILFGSPMVFVSFGLLAARTTASPSGAIRGVPAI